MTWGDQSLAFVIGIRYWRISVTLGSGIAGFNCTLIVTQDSRLRCLTIWYHSLNSTTSLWTWVGITKGCLRSRAPSIRQRQRVFQPTPERGHLCSLRRYRIFTYLGDYFSLFRDATVIFITPHSSFVYWIWNSVLQFVRTRKLFIFTSFDISQSQRFRKSFPGHGSRSSQNRTTAHFLPFSDSAATNCPSLLFSSILSFGEVRSNPSQVLQAPATRMGLAQSRNRWSMIVSWVIFPRRIECSGKGAINYFFTHTFLAFTLTTKGLPRHPLENQLEALQLLQSEDFQEEVAEESKDEAQREKDALADKLIQMYGGGDAGIAPPGPFGESHGFPSSQWTDQRDPVRSQRSNPSHRYPQQLQQQPHRTRTRSTRSGDILESRPHAFTATEKDFSPRILNKPKVTSKLSQSKHYYRPKPKPLIKSSMLAGEMSLPPYLS